MDFAVPRFVYRFIIPVVALLIAVVAVIIPLGKSALNSFFGDEVTVEYKAKVVSIEGNKAQIEWHEDEIVVPSKGNTYVSQQMSIDLNKYKHVKVGDTFTVAVTEPGLLKKVGAEEQRDVEVVKHNINFFKLIWRKLFG